MVQFCGDVAVQVPSAREIKREILGYDGSLLIEHYTADHKTPFFY